jgi:hypothetical protein
MAKIVTTARFIPRIEIPIPKSFLGRHQAPVRISFQALHPSTEAAAARNVANTWLKYGIRAAIFGFFGIKPVLTSICAYPGCIVEPRMAVAAL